MNNYFSLFGQGYILQRCSILFKFRFLDQSKAYLCTKRSFVKAKNVTWKKVSGIVNLLHGRCKCEIKSKAKSCLWKHEIAFTVFPLIWAAFLCLNKYGGRHTLSLFLCQMRSKCQLFFYPPCALRVFGLSLVPSTRFIERERYKVFLCCRRKIKNGFI